MKDLRKIVLVQDYVKVFIMIMLDIRDMMEKDKLFFFMDNLFHDATIEL